MLTKLQKQRGMRMSKVMKVNLRNVRLFNHTVEVISQAFRVNRFTKFSCRGSVKIFV